MKRLGFPAGAPGSGAGPGPRHLVGLLALIGCACSHGSQRSMETVIDTLHGVPVADPFRWLEDGDDPRVRAWSDAQHRAAREALDRLPGRSALRTRLARLSYHDQVSIPVKRGSRWFWRRRDQHREKAVHLWREDEGGPPQVLVDPNGTDLSIQGLRVSSDGRWAAFRASVGNRDESTIEVVEVGRREWSDVDRIPGVRYVDPSWVAGRSEFYYTRFAVESARSPTDREGAAGVYRHQVGRPFERDELVFEGSGDPGTLIGPDVSRDGQFLFSYVVTGAVKTDVYLQRLDRPDDEIRPLFVDEDARFFAFAHEGRIYARTNHEAERWRVIRIDDPDQPDRRREIVPEHPAAVLEEASVVGGRLSLRYSLDGSSFIQIADLDGELLRTVEFPGVGWAEGLTGDPSRDEAFYSFQSFLQPPSIYRTSVDRGGRTVHARVDIPADPELHSVERTSYRSADGTEIPMFLVLPEGFQVGDEIPFLLTGYGGFGVSVRPLFDPGLHPWLEAGGGVALPGLRGGGERGEAWHRAGMLTNKQNVFDDFIAAAEHLIREGYAASDRLAIRGGSNGGLLVGAAMTQRPDLFAAVVCRAPLLDMIRYHRFGAARRWVSEYGSSEDPVEFRALLAYSPYHNVEPGVRHPPILLMSRGADDRVDPMHARKFAARLQRFGGGSGPVLLRIEEGTGHAGADQVALRIAAEVDELAFLFSQLDMTPPPTEPDRAR